MPNPRLSESLKRQALDAVNQSGGSVTEAAKLLGVPYPTLQARLRSAGWVRPEPAVVAPTRQTMPTPTLAIAKSPIELQAEIDDLRGQLAAVTEVKRWAAAPAKTKPREQGAKHMYVPDPQVKVGVPINHLEAAGNYAAEKRPDTIVLGGDWWDMPSLSVYDRGKLCFEGRRYRSDIEAGKAGMEKFLAPIRKTRGYNPRIVFTMGNHEERIERARQEHAVLSDMIGYQDLCLDKFGVEVHEFLKVVRIDGVAYSHYFPRAGSGSVRQSKNGAPNAKAQLIREGRSAVAGHAQGLDVHCQYLDGKMQWGIIAGSFYQHEEKYLTPQGETHWRGIVMLHDVRDGELDPMYVSLNYLLKKYA